MCTLSLLPGERSLSAWMNRDENPSRGAEARKIVRSGSSGSAALYPLDPISQGTWIGINEHGLLLALLNEYPEGGLPASKSSASRGALIPAALGEDSVSAASEI